MADQNKDVKPKTDASSTSEQTATTKDVKTLDQEAERLVAEQATAESSTGEEQAEEGAVLEENSTEEGKESEESAEEAEQKTDEGKEGEEETDKGEQKETTEHEEAVPYTRFKEVNDKLVSMQPEAEAQRRLSQFCQANNITVEQFQQALELLRLENANPAEALKHYTNKLESLRVSTGTGLPADLQKEVEEGVLSESRAKEIAQLRLKSTQAERSSQAATFDAEQRQRQAAVDTLQQWAVTKQKTDPSFKPKAGPNAVDGRWEDWVDKFARFNLEKPPQTLQDYLSNAETAYDMLVKRVAAAVKKPKKVITSDNASHRSTTPPEPKSMDDVAANVARKHGYTI